MMYCELRASKAKLNTQTLNIFTNIFLLLVPHEQCLRYVMQATVQRNAPNHNFTVVKFLPKAISLVEY